jgi:endonuclease-3 related protein
MSAEAAPPTNRLLDLYRRLEAACDIDGWHWRDDTGWLEICLGAILVQHSAWANVERALARLRDAGAFSLPAIAALPEADLADLVRPAGLPVQRARRLKRFAALVERCGGPERLLALPSDELRRVLLATPGIGPETADVIALFAARRPVFPVDAYARRLFRRLGLGPRGDGYDAWQRWFDAGLPEDVELYRRYRAGIVLHCKSTCRTRPRCPGCCLLDICPTGQSSLG